MKSSKNSLVMYQENEAYFTAVLELRDMFDGGGVLIDHYIIQVDNGTQLETAGPTYSFDIMYNTTLSVNISAHNCAGYSDPFPLEIEYEQGKTKNGAWAAVQYVYATDIQKHITTVTEMSNMMSALMTTLIKHSQSPSPTVIVKYEPTANKLLLIALPVSTAAITVIIVSAMTLLYTFRRCGKCLLISFEVVLSCFVRDVE